MFSSCEKRLFEFCEDAEARISPQVVSARKAAAISSFVSCPCLASNVWKEWELIGANNELKRLDCYGGSWMGNIMLRLAFGLEETTGT